LTPLRECLLCFDPDGGQFDESPECGVVINALRVPEKTKQKKQHAPKQHNVRVRLVKLTNLSFTDNRTPGTLDDSDCSFICP
jgi:hypothetical protein